MGCQAAKQLVPDAQGAQGDFVRPGAFFFFVMRIRLRTRLRLRLRTRLRRMRLRFRLRTRLRIRVYNARCTTGYTTVDDSSGLAEMSKILYQSRRRRTRNKALNKGLVANDGNRESRRRTSRPRRISSVGMILVTPWPETKDALGVD